MTDAARNALVRSLLTEENPFNSTGDVIDWIANRNREVGVSVEEIPFAAMKGWHFDGETGNLVHDSGRFFSIIGLDVRASTYTQLHWQQPVINQPEVGYLGIVAKIFDGVMYFLLQAKIEPGNVNCVQLSPTLQATRSNYTCVHKGRIPAYLDYFRKHSPHEVLLDQLQSEQGARFYRKRNRNIILLPDAKVTATEDFRWLTLGQIHTLLRRDNMVNMDTRTVLSGLRFPADESGLPPLSDWGRELFASEASMDGESTVDGVLYWLSELKTVYELVVDKLPLRDVDGWMVTEREIVRPDRRFFRVLGVDVTIENREVANWCQPLVQPMQHGISVLFAQRRRGVMQFLLQAKVECGNFDVVELAPTIQCQTGNWRLAPPGLAPAFLPEFDAGRIPGRMVVDAMQSEEGGRFYREQNRNVVFLLDDGVELDVPKNFKWLTLGQIKEFLRFNNYLNIQVRSLVAALEYR